MMATKKFNAFILTTTEYAIVSFLLFFCVVRLACKIRMLAVYTWNKCQLEKMDLAVAINFMVPIRRFFLYSDDMHVIKIQIK